MEYKVSVFNGLLLGAVSKNFSFQHKNFNKNYI